MPLELVTIPCLNDNYAYLLHDAASGHTTLVDAPEATPILNALAARGWALDQILLTHHHSDHIQGVPDLVAATGATVLGARADAHRLPPLARALAEGDSVPIGPETAFVLDVSGHTMGHIAFHLPQSALAFTADSLMAGGCGRLFEGTPAIMWHSLMKLAALPGETLICSGHEYTTANLPSPLRSSLTTPPCRPASPRSPRPAPKTAPPCPRACQENWRPTLFFAPACPISRL